MEEFDWNTCIERAKEIKTNNFSSYIEELKKLTIYLKGLRRNLFVINKCIEKDNIALLEYLFKEGMSSKGLIFCILQKKNINLLDFGFKYEKDIYFGSCIVNESYNNKYLTLHDRINLLKISPMGDNVIISSDDRQIRDYGIHDKELSLLKTIKDHQGAVSDLLYSQNGQYFCSCSYDENVIVYDSNSYQIVFQFEAFASSICFYSTNVINFIDLDGYLRSYDLKLHMQTDVLHLPDDMITKMINSNDERYVGLYGSNIAFIALLNPFKIVFVLVGHSDRINCLKFNDDCSLCATGSNDEMIKVWSLTNGQCIATFDTTCCSNVFKDNNAHHIEHIKTQESVESCKTSAPSLLSTSNIAITLNSFTEINSIEFVNFIDNDSKIVCCKRNGVVQVWLVEEKQILTNTDSLLNGLIHVWCCDIDCNYQRLIFSGNEFNSRGSVVSGYNFSVDKKYFSKLFFDHYDLFVLKLVELSHKQTNLLLCLFENKIFDYHRDELLILLNNGYYVSLQEYTFLDDNVQKCLVEFDHEGQIVYISQNYELSLKSLTWEEFHQLEFENFDQNVLLTKTFELLENVSSTTTTTTTTTNITRNLPLNELCSEMIEKAIKIGYLDLLICFIENEFFGLKNIPKLLIVYEQYWMIPLILKLNIATIEYPAEIRKIFQTMKGHTNIIWNLKITKDGKFLATFSEDCTLRIWNTNTKQCIRILDIFFNNMLDMCFNDNGTLFATCDNDGFVTIFDCTNNWKVLNVSSHYNIQCMIFYKDKYLFTGDSSGFIQKITLDTFQILCRKKIHDDAISFIDCKDRYIATASLDKTGIIFDLENFEVFDLPISHDDGLSKIKFVTTLELFSVSFDGVIKLWNMKTLENNPSDIIHTKSNGLGCIEYLNPEQFVWFDKNNDLILFDGKSNSNCIFFSGLTQICSMVYCPFSKKLYYSGFEPAIVEVSGDVIVSKGIFHRERSEN
eukprot:TRINITY_DN980_c0_g1_i1.p1 TRINITY_DN980_c0_g1~~TRINITY_DN980_c0_g1_i1.p1  ORF type:complete len:960 (-),score=223.82 TRINITY_DN980_c0_g1_i1:163-3042(-)